MSAFMDEKDRVEIHVNGERVAMTDSAELALWIRSALSADFARLGFETLAELKKLVLALRTSGCRDGAIVNLLARQRETRAIGGQDRD